MNNYRAGIDIGSTTIKLTVLDEDGKILYGDAGGGQSTGGSMHAESEDYRLRIH